MEVRDKNIGDSKFGLPRFSSVEAASIMETEYEGSTVKCAAKTAQSRWRLETCLCRKEIWAFWVYLNLNAEQKTVFKFDDEMKSLLSANLWEIGLYSLLQDECKSEIGTEKPGGISVIDGDAI